MIKKNKLTKRLFFLSLLFLAFILLLLFSVYNIYFSGLIYPKTTIVGFSVSGKSPKEASELLSKNISVPTEIELVRQDELFNIDLGELDFSYDFGASSQKAYALTRSGNFFLDLHKRLISIFRKSELELSFVINEEKLKEALSVIDSQTSTPPIYPSLKLVKGIVEIDKGSAGTVMDKDGAISLIYKSLSEGKREQLSLPLKKIDPSIDDVSARFLAERAQKILNKSIIFNFEFQSFAYSGQALLNFLNPLGGYSDEEIGKAIAKIAAVINRPPQDPTFVFDGGRVNEFAPSKDGIVLREETIKEMFVGNLSTLELSDEEKIILEVPYDKTPSKVKTEDVNNLGIKELVGRGTSMFAHSIPNRIHNVGLASSRFKGVLVKPGEIFSFNDALGDVSSFTGYKQAFVIKDGKTVLGDGGGVCQVSSTLFRAILDAGLPIIERRAHSYRVGYYEQGSPPGFDATVFSPSTDLKFKNDTPGHLLIQPIFDAKTQTLVFEIYGTNDGRVATTSTPKVSKVSAPPPDLYVDEPTLPAGTIKQIEFRAAGANVSFDYKVVREGEEIYSKTFVSNYRPWQAIYLKGTAPN